MGITDYSTIRQFSQLLPTSRVVGAVLVVGAGIAGIQASLDVAESGYFVYLVERAPAIGGIMPMLDKTFPTNDCSLCILSPKLVECARHPNIKIYSSTELLEVQGGPGNFKATLRTLPRYIDPNKCNNCGQCTQICPTQHLSNEFNQGLDQRAAIYKLYAQAFPDAYCLDGDNCQRCHRCERVCSTGAINLDRQEEILTLKVGAIILCPGFGKIDPLPLYGYGRFPNVLTSLELERILSAGGPFSGHLLRPYDRRKPKKIAWIQCVGSRSVLEGRGYCSSICCRYAIKEAIIAKEYGADTAIFFMDIRAYNKGLERYYNRAKNDYGVRFIRSRPSEVIERQDERRNLIIRYLNQHNQEQGREKIVSEEFDLVVLSLGSQPSTGAVELARRLGLDLNQYGFSQDGNILPKIDEMPNKSLDLNQYLKRHGGSSVSAGSACTTPGIYGAFSGPKDISETVTQAGAAASEAAGWIDEARGELVKEKTFPQNLVVEKPRVGVFVCHCGVNISQTVRVSEVAEAARQQVVYAAELVHACSQDSQIAIREAIGKYCLNRVVVAACSPHTHRPLFQETIQEAGLNKYLVAMANIRDQCAWVHKNEPDQATSKAVDLVMMKVVKSALLEPIKRTSVDLTRSALVIGGGVAGMTCSLSLASQNGYEVHLVEKSAELGGMARRIKQGLGGENIQSLLSKLIGRVQENPLIKIHLSADIKQTRGSAGNFITTLAEASHTSSGDEQSKNTRQIRHGVTIIATGAREYQPSEYLYGQSDRVMTYLELDEALDALDERIKESKNIVLINCVGSREPDRPYCSRVCCNKAVRLALKIRTLYPQANVFVLYRDMRTYGFMEDIYRQARLKGVIFIRYQEDNKPRVEKNGIIQVTDHVLKQPVIIEADLIGLAAAILPAEDNTGLSQILKVPLDEDGFFLEAHIKLRPVDCACRGIFLAGSAQGPKNLEENIIQAKAAAARAAGLLSKKALEAPGLVARIQPDRCMACLTCMRVCLFNAPRIKNYAVEIDPSCCQGCGACVSECPNQAITLDGYNDHIYLAMAESLFNREHNKARRKSSRKEPKIIAFCCSYCAYAAADLAGSMRLQYPANIRIIEVPCSGDVGEQVIIQSLEKGADGVLVAGCLEGGCHFMEGNCRAGKRVEAVKKILDEIGLGSQRLEMYYLSSAMGLRFAEIAQQMTERIRQLGPNPFNKTG